MGIIEKLLLLVRYTKPKHEFVGVAETNAQKARLAARYGQQMLRMGAPHRFASDSALHELRHGVADKGGMGAIGYTLRRERFGKGGHVTPFYFLLGENSPERARRCAKGPKKDMSDDDHRVVNKYR